LLLTEEDARAAGRASAKEITLFKSAGIAAWDVAVAARVYERAIAEKRGVQTPLWERSE
jgi:ornithine cyclodeaminase/alanine dehydrogenase-like protein (mu-crystallin family)